MSLYFQFLCFAFFVRNSKIEYGPQFWGEEKFWKIGAGSLLMNPQGVENFNEIALSRTVKEIQAVLCFTL